MSFGAGSARWAKLSSQGSVAAGKGKIPPSCATMSDSGRVIEWRAVSSRVTKGDQRTSLTR